jgi:uncharacterized membrane protein YesL
VAVTWLWLLAFLLGGMVLGIMWQDKSDAPTFKDWF